MKKDGLKGSITIFLSLTCLLFLALICALVESARVQGAKTQSANIAGMGSFSVLGEFEKELLEKYEIFGLDGAYGTGTFQISQVKAKLDEYISYNADPGKNISSVLSFDPWKLQMTNSDIAEYALLTDDHGEPFYQQVVSYMKENMAFIAVDELKKYAEKKDEIENREKQYEEALEKGDSEMDKVNQQTQDKLDELKEEAEAAEVEFEEPEIKVENPITVMDTLKGPSGFDVIIATLPVADTYYNVYQFPSYIGVPKGKMKLETPHGGLVDDLLFREYLMKYFTNYRNQKKSASFAYQLEYILGGECSDKENLEEVVDQLLAVREAMNYLYCVQDSTMSSEAYALAVMLVGWTGIPGLPTLVKHSLLLAWAYAESLVDVKTLLEGGKVPLFKDPTTWVVSIDQIVHIVELIYKGGQNRGKGFDYEEYLRILLNMGSLKKQKMRALDLIQFEISSAGYNSGFKVQNCIVGVKCSTDWTCKPVFAGLPSAVLGGSLSAPTFHQESSMAY